MFTNFTPYKFIGKFVILIGFFKSLMWDEALDLELLWILEIFKLNTASNKLCPACLRKDGFSFALPHDKGSSSSKHTRIKNIPLIDRVHIRSAPKL